MGDVPPHPPLSIAKLLVMNQSAKYKMFLIHFKVSCQKLHYCASKKMRQLCFKIKSHELQGCSVSSKYGNKCDNSLIYISLFIKMADNIKIGGISAEGNNVYQALQLWFLL
jgi:hypothetical protein